MKKQEIEWAQLKARIPRKLHRDAKIASAILDRPIVDICIEALEKAVQEAAIAKSDEVAA